MTERELPAGVTRLELGNGGPLDDLPIVDVPAMDWEPPAWSSDAEPQPSRFEVPSEVVHEDELWEQYAEACGFGPREEWIAFGDGPEQHDVDDFVYVAMGGCSADERPWTYSGPDPRSPEYESDYFAYEEAVAEAHAEHGRERERIFETLLDAHDADSRTRATVLLSPASVVSHVRRGALRAPRSRRASRTRSRARSPGRPSGDDDPPSRPPLVARREAGS